MRATSARDGVSPLIAAIVAVGAALALAAVIGWLLTRRAGDVRATDPTTAGEVDTSDLGLSHDGPTVVHFSAPWCSPCTQVRRVVTKSATALATWHTWKSIWTPIQVLRDVFQ